LATIIRQSYWLYPGLEIIHIIGIALMVGAAFMFDLRLLGYAKAIPVDQLGELLLSWSQRGFWLILPSGLLLFITNAETLGNNPVFWAKISLILMGGLNAFVFHQNIRKISKTDPLPYRFKINALISILVWISVIACGRLLAY
jgi:hypothetical protein